MKICTNCIQEINQSFSFTKRCEATDTILRKCVKIKTELVNDPWQSQKIEPINKTEIKIEIKPEMLRADKGVLEESGCVGDVEQEEDVNPEFTPEIISSNVHQSAKESLGDFEFVEVVNQSKEVKIEYAEKTKKLEEDLKIEHECDETYDPADESYDEDQEENSEKSDNSVSNQRRKVSLDSHAKVRCS